MWWTHAWLDSAVTGSVGMWRSLQQQESPCYYVGSVHTFFFFVQDSSCCGDPAAAMPTMTSGREGERRDLWKLACSVTESLCLKSSTHKHSYFIRAQDSGVSEIPLNAVWINVSVVHTCKTAGWWWQQVENYRAECCHYSRSVKCLLGWRGADSAILL